MENFPECDAMQVERRNRNDGGCIRFMLSGKHNYAAFYYEIKTQQSQAPNVFTSARFSHLEVVVLIEIVKIATILKRNHSRVQNTDEM